MVERGEEAAGASVVVEADDRQMAPQLHLPASSDDRQVAPRLPPPAFSSQRAYPQACPQASPPPDAGAAREKICPTHRPPLRAHRPSAAAEARERRSQVRVRVRVRVEG